MASSSKATELAQSSVALLDDALGLPPAQLGQEVDTAEREIARLRDVLIADLRAGNSSVRETLDTVNAALSLVVGVEYPAAGIQRDALKQARDALKALGST